MNSIRGCFKKIEGKSGIELPRTPVLIGNWKEMIQKEFNPNVPTLEYQQDDSNICCFSSLSSELYASG